MESFTEKWRYFNSEELSRQYSPSQWATEPDKVISIHTKILREASDRAKTCVDCELGVKLGHAELHRVDIFGRKNAAEGSPAFVYIHGGYWQELGLEYSSFPAINITNAGGVFYAIGYSIAPRGTMEQMIDEVKAGVLYALKDAEARNFSGVCICGHSAGAHLTSLMLSVDWQAEGADPTLLKGAVLVSGIYDLRPLVTTYVNDLLKMTEDSAAKISPQFCSEQIIRYSQNRKILIVLAKYDSEEFVRQGQDFYDALNSLSSCNVFLKVVPDADHFNIIEKIINPNYELLKDILRIMGQN